jgi:Tol biopolymer transport system component
MDPALSPDGDLVAFQLVDNPDTSAKVAVLRLSDGHIVKTFAAPPEGPGPIPRQWTGAGILFDRSSAGGSNIWAQLFDGGPPRQLTNFASERIARFEWSPDGKSLLYAHGTMNNDVVLISNVPRGR